MRKLILTICLVAGSFLAKSQPGELPKFVYQSTPFQPINDVVLSTERYINEIESTGLTPVTLQDSALLFQPFTPHSNLQFKPSELPGSYKPEMVVYLDDNEIVKIVFGNHTFHFVGENLLRSWHHCLQVTAMGQCGGFVTSANTFYYWNGSRVYRSIAWQSHPHPCACYEEGMYDYKTAMALLFKAQNLLMAQLFLEAD